MEFLPAVAASGWTSGLSAYGTVLVLGLLGRLGIGQVPEVLSRPGILIGAGILFATEFIVDKVPYLDNLWDAAHTVIRPVIAGFVGVQFAGDADALGEAVSAVGAGSMAVASHAVKAGLRLAVNTSPEPFSTIAVSTVEDLLMAGVSYLVATRPWVAFGIAAVLLAGGILLLIAIRRRIARFLERIRGRPPGSRALRPRLRP